ncbi:hypothetical protein HQ560_11160 [bacterium]|nr:hypothetical protein [bacterium]
MALDLKTGEPQADVVAGMKEFIEFRKQAIEAIRQHFSQPEEVNHIKGE